MYVDGTDIFVTLPWLTWGELYLPLPYFTLPYLRPLDPGTLDLELTSFSVETWHSD